MKTKSKKSFFYVYISSSMDGRYYIGSRKSKVSPHQDTKYMGSYSDKTFRPCWKTIIKEVQSLREARQLEHDLLLSVNGVYDIRCVNKALWSVDGSLKAIESSKQLTGASSPFSCHTVYAFTTPNGNNFVGNRYDAAEYYGINPNTLRRLIQTPQNRGKVQILACSLKDRLRHTNLS